MAGTRATVPVVHPDVLNADHHTDGISRKVMTAEERIKLEGIEPGAKTGDMLESTYDPDANEANAFDLSNQYGSKPTDFATVADLLADTSLGYSAARRADQVAAGMVVNGQGFRYEVAASGATDHHVETAGGVKLYVEPENGAASIIAFGAVADGDAVGSRGTDNTPLLVPSLQAIKARGGDTLLVPPYCQADWMTVAEDAAPNTRIIDCSGYDYTHTTVPYQMNVVIIQFTALSGGGTVGHAYNGQVFRLSGHYHVAYVVESLRPSGSGSGSKASYVFYSEGRPDWQMAYDRTTSGAERFALVSYGPLDAVTVLNIGGQVSGNFKQWTFNSSSFVPNASYVYLQSGDVGDANYLTKGMLNYYRIPSGSTGDFTSIYQMGTSGQLSRDVVRNDGSRSIWSSANAGVEITASGGVGFKRDASVLTAGVLNLTVAQSGKILSNIGASAGVQFNLPTTPSSAVGTHFLFHVDAASQVTIVPRPGERFTNNSDGEWMRSVESGAWAEVTCIADGLWTFKRGGTWTDQ